MFFRKCLASININIDKPVHAAAAFNIIDRRNINFIYREYTRMLGHNKHWILNYLNAVERAPHMANVNNISLSLTVQRDNIEIKP